MKKNYSRSNIVQALRDTYADPQAIAANLGDSTLPKDLAAWLSRLALLHGVPFNYLVPDERMLPPESIRFFYLDMNWIGALTDGAFSIGRNLTNDQNSATLNMDRALHPTAMKQVNAATTHIRARVFGLNAAPPPSIISGFVLRSSLVLDYPSLGVNVYPFGQTPKDPNPKMLTLLRLEQLGATDTMICLVSGDAYRVDIHEAPQALHYGLDCYDNDCTVQGNAALAVKNLYTFTIESSANAGSTTTQQIKMSTTPTPTDVSTCIRTNNTRALDISTLAALIAKANNISSIDSAEMGFEMTEGVGMVSFFKTT